MTIPHRRVFSRAAATAAFFIAFGMVVAGVPWARAGEACHQVVASYYGKESGSRTATGTFFDGTGFTAAMPSRSMLGKRVRVTFRGRSVVVLVDDIGPASWTRRGIDLSKRAALALGLVSSGTGLVCLSVLP